MRGSIFLPLHFCRNRINCRHMNSVYPLTLLDDAACPVCALEMDHLRSRNTAGRLVFVNIAAPGFDAAAFGACAARAPCKARRRATELKEKHHECPRLWGERLCRPCRGKRLALARAPRDRGRSRPGRRSSVDARRFHAAPRAAGVGGCAGRASRGAASCRSRRSGSPQTRKVWPHPTCTANCAPMTHSQHWASTGPYCAHHSSTAREAKAPSCSPRSPACR